MAFYDSKGRILLQDRRGIAKVGEEWGFFGGGIETGETPVQALLREIQEELNFKLTEYELLTTYRVFLPGDEQYNKIWLFIGPLGDNLQNMKQSEGRGMKLFTTDEARTLKMPRRDVDVFEIIEKYLNKLLLVFNRR